MKEGKERKNHIIIHPFSRIQIPPIFHPSIPVSNLSI